MTTTGRLKNLQATSNYRLNLFRNAVIFLQRYPTFCSFEEGGMALLHSFRHYNKGRSGVGFDELNLFPAIYNNGSKGKANCE